MNLPFWHSSSMNQYRGWISRRLLDRKLFLLALLTVYACVSLISICTVLTQQLDSQATQTITPDAYFHTSSVFRRTVSWQLAYPHLRQHHIRKSDVARTVQRLHNQIPVVENGVQVPVVDPLHHNVSRRNNVNWQLARPYLKQHNYSSAASTTLRLSSQPPVDKNEGAQLPVLDSLHHNSQDVDLLMKKQLRLCTSMLSRSSGSDDFYQKQVDAGLNAWYTFIPRRVRHSYCWHAQFNMPNADVQELLAAWVDLRDIEQRYSTSYASLMLDLIHGRRVIPGLMAHNLGDGTSSNFFCLPNIYLAGFPKCGTTSLYSLITSHPLLAKPYSKEGHFWREFVKTVNPLYKELDVLHYLFHCKAAAKEMETSTAKITIDASASTVFASPNTGMSMEKDMCILPILLSKVLPDAKYIVIMRNPVERLWSDYWYFCAKAHWKVRRNNTKYFNIPNDVALHASEIFHNHTMSVVDDFKTCLLENRSEFECVMRAHSEDGKVAACMGARVGVGLYYFHIVKWLSILPRDKFLFLRMEDLIEDTFNVMLKVWTFLEIDSLSKEVLDHHILNSMKTNANTWIGLEEYRDKFKMSPITHRQLTSFHQPYNQRLAKLLNDDCFLWND